MADNADFGTFGRFIETPVGQMPEAMKQAYDMTKTLRGLVPGPHKIWLANPTLSQTIVPTGAYFQTTSTLTKTEIEIATNVINGHWRAAYGNYEHEKIGIKKGGLAPEKVTALIAGLPTSFDDPPQQVVYELASTLAAARVVPLGLYRRARDLLADAGILDVTTLDVTTLMGWFITVSLTLMAYDVPSDAVGLDQETQFNQQNAEGRLMPITPPPTVTLTPVAYFPEKYFLENLAVRSDGSVLITAVLQKQLWCVPGPQPHASLSPVLVHTFEHPVTGIVEVEPEVFIVSLSDAYTTHESHLARVDLGGWTPGDPVSPEIIVTFDERVRGLNGSCLLAPRVMLAADCFAGLIWRIDLAESARSATARVWLAHDTMAMDPDSEVAPPPQPGVNGVRYGAQTGYLYYTSTAQQVFMRVPVDPTTLDPAGDAEFVAAIDNADDFCLDDNAGFAYVTRHRANTIDRVPLTPRHGSEVRHIAGDPFDTVLVGPSSAAWGRGPSDHGRVAYVTTDGGTTAPPEGIVRKATLLRVELQPHTTS